MPRKNGMTIANDQLQLDLNRRGLIYPDGSVVKLRPQSLQVFEFLLNNPGQIISRERIHKAVWGDMHVTDDSFSQCIGDIRRALAMTIDTSCKQCLKKATNCLTWTIMTVTS